MKKFLRVDEVAKILRCSTKTVDRLLKEDLKLEAFKRRGRNLIVKESLDRYIREEIEDFQIDHGCPEYPSEEFK